MKLWQSQRNCAVDIEFANLAYNVNVNKKDPPKTILSGVSGEFRHGFVNVIMGPSGAGKSSLLNCLVGFNDIVNGDIAINGQWMPAAKCQRVMQSISSYILQDDTLIIELTAYETLRFATSFKIAGLPAESLDKTAEKILKKIGLQDVRNVRVGNLSGGQRKRIAVAVELINYPPVVFLDECTTGLDSSSTLSLMRILKTMARHGCNIIATIHQPNSMCYRHFDWLYLMAPGGRLAYSGHPMALPATLGLINISCGVWENPSDVVFEKDNIPRLAEAWSDVRDKSIEYSKKVRMRKSRKLERITDMDQLIVHCDRVKPSEFRRFLALAHRTAIENMRNVASSLFRFLAFILIGILIGALFPNSAIDAAFVYANVSVIYFVGNSLFGGTGMVTAVNAEPTIKSAMSEHVNSWYSTGTYYLVRSLVEFVMNVSGTTCMVFTVWPMTAQPTYSYLLAWCTNVATSLTTHFAMFMMTLYGDTKANLQYPFLIATLQCFFGGYMIAMDDLAPWFRWIRYINYGVYQFSACMKATYSPLDAPGQAEFKLKCPNGSMTCYAYPNGTTVLKYFKIDTTTSGWDDFWKLCIFLVGFAILGWPVLARRLGKARRQIARIA